MLANIFVIREKKNKKAGKHIKSMIYNKINTL